MNTYLIKLQDGTVGKVISANSPVVGHEMTITSHDDFGQPILVTGIVEDVLEDEQDTEELKE